MRSRLMLVPFFALAMLPFVSSNAPAMAPVNLVKVNHDIDVYAEPGGAGEPFEKFLPAGSTVTLLTERPDHWCNVQGDAVPGGTGWVWCGIGEDGINYALTPVEAAPDMGGTPEAPEGGEGAPAPDAGPNAGPHE